MRPQFRPSLKPTDKFLEFLAGLLVLVFIAGIIYYYPLMPDTIPTHFDFSGKVDDYGCKNTVFAILTLLLILYSGLSALNRAPWVFNYSVEITEENAEAQYREGTRLLRVVKVMVVLIFLVVEYESTQAAIQGTMKLGMIGPMLVGVLVIGILVYAIYSVRKAK